MDFRSDTVTRPTASMREAMKEAIVGDDVYRDDPTVIQLEEEMAKRLGKEAALFVPTGTFSNQLAIKTHTQPSDEVILLEDSHIMIHEAGAPGLISGVNLRSARSFRGEYDLEELESLIRLPGNIHFPKTALICLENAHGNGRAIPLDHMQTVREVASRHGIPIHLDGARLFNAAVSLERNPEEIAACADSVSVCLSKGLCAPVGSLLCGTRDWIERARKFRKILGGGMRQVGVLAAAGLVAMEEMIPRLENDHSLANYLGIKLDEIEGLDVLWDRLDINMVFFKWHHEISLEEELGKAGILINGMENHEYRLVTHHDVTAQDIDCLYLAIREILSS